MTTPEIVLLIIFLTFLTGCGLYIARASRRQKAHRASDPELTMELERKQAEVENGPSRR